MIPMWGESGALFVAPGNNEHTIELTRALARVDLGVGAADYDTMDDRSSWNGKDGSDNVIPFVLTNVYIIRPNQRYAVAPDVTKAVGEPTIPGGTTAFSAVDSEVKFKYATPGGCTTQEIYTPEFDIKMSPTGTSGDINHINRMAVVVGGRYNGSSTETFYRIDFAINKSLIDVLRNHLYLISISGVTGPGYDDVVTAYESIPMNMTVDIYEWNETDMSEIFMDGFYRLLLKNSRNENRDDRHAIVYRNIGSNDVIEFKTNIPLDKINMELDHGGDFPNPTDKTVIENSRFRVAIKNESGKYYFEFTALEAFDESATDNPSILTVTAGRIQFEITIEQRDGGPGSWIDGGNTDKDF